jgi:hypothetical protein
LGDLAADGRLLNSIWHVAGGGGNAFVLRHVLEQLQVMNVHGEQQSAAEHAEVNDPFRKFGARPH